MLLIEVMCIPNALIMLVRTHMDIHLVSVGYYCMQQCSLITDRIGGLVEDPGLGRNLCTL